MGFETEYLKERYTKMSFAQLELIIAQIKWELEHHPDANQTELLIAVEALEEKKKAEHKQKKDRPCLPGRLEHQLDVGEEF
ncbi:MAG: hypothetical protein P1P80_08225 [ANME-2 cluster archaeon]|nr:hypothetical protein [ANME-2 cluster archaeon]